MGYALGYDPERAAAAKALMRAGRHARASAAPLQSQAKSLLKYRTRKLCQGEAGTCWLHAPSAHAEIGMRAKNLTYRPVCRRLVGYEGKKIEGGGNPSSGGFGGDAYKALASAGIADETLCPYTDDARTLGRKPAADVYESAKAAHFTEPVDVPDLDAAFTLIDKDDEPTSIGIWWPYGWDDARTFMTAIGHGVFGHELLIVGYAKAGVWNHGEWVQLLNWHDDLYPVLDPKLAADVEGYVTLPESGGKTDSFWVERSVLETVMGYGNSDLTSASDFDGLAPAGADWSGAFAL